MSVDTRYFGLWPETTYNVFEAPTFYIDTASANIRKDNNAEGLPDMSQQTPRRHTIGPFTARGPIELALDAITCGYFIYGLMGSMKSTKVGTTYAYEHVSPDATTEPVATLPSFSMIIGQGPDVVQEERLAGMGFARGTINADASSTKGVRLSVDVTGNFEDLNPSLSAPTFDDLPVFEFVHGALTLDDGALPCHKVEIEITNAIVEDYVVLGSRDLYRLYAEGRTIRVTYDVPFLDDSQYNYVLGSSVATSPQTALLTVDLDLVLDTAEIVEGTFTMELLINIPRVLLNSLETNVDGRGRIIVSVEGEALYSSTDKFPIQFTLVNDKVSYAT